MPKIKFKNLYAKDMENPKAYKVYDVLEIEYQDNGDDEKFAKIVTDYLEKNVDALETYNRLAEDMVIEPEQARDWRFFGKNAAAAVAKMIPFFVTHGNKDMLDANKGLKVEEVDGI